MQKILLVGETHPNAVRVTTREKAVELYGTSPDGTALGDIIGDFLERPADPLMVVPLEGGEEE